MTKNFVIIFVRNPKLGKVKTRLAASIGDQKALEVYQILLHKTKTITQNLTCDKAVYYSNKTIKNDIWDNTIYQKHQQKGSNLGMRMQSAFKKAFDMGYKKVLIIGSDLYDLTQSHINKAFEKLNSNDVVMGPAKDGGYYLLAMKKLHANIFENKAWGTATVKTETLNDLKDNRVYLLDELNDIDVIEDLENHAAFKSFL
ncbi:TIGR04282 family arsenosugar biosynthesis glycosyltransferase [Tenacibaculum sp. UWU-22]|uniref:TIGR04282 family arsenosugar biosynthesis glycosyltransferase n=1 Tax=Tenacibaculum sp. UWU-22 TaxID=3234187 RepID=UPI0034DB215F